MIPIIRTTRAAAPPIVPPAITPDLLTDFGADDASDVDEVSPSCELTVGAPVGGNSGGEDVGEVESEEIWAFVEDAEAVLLTTKSPFFCLQHASARVSFPQQ